MIKKAIFSISPDYIELKERVRKLEATVRGMTIFIATLSVCFLVFVTLVGVFS